MTEDHGNSYAHIVGTPPDDKNINETKVYITAYKGGQC